MSCLLNILFFTDLAKNVSQFTKNASTFFQKIVTKPSKICGLGSEPGIQKKSIPDPGVKKAPDPGSGSATLVMLVPTHEAPLLSEVYSTRTVTNYNNSMKPSDL